MLTGVDKVINAVNDMHMNPSQAKDLRIQLQQVYDPFDEEYRRQLQKFFNRVGHYNGE